MKADLNHTLTAREAVALRFLQLQASGSWNVKFNPTDYHFKAALRSADRFLELARTQDQPERELSGVNLDEFMQREFNH